MRTVVRLAAGPSGPRALSSGNRHPLVTCFRRSDMMRAVYWTSVDEFGGPPYEPIAL